MTSKDIGTRHAPAVADPLHSCRLTYPTVLRELHAERRQVRSRQGKLMSAPWQNAKPHRQFHAPEHGCSQGQRLSVHPFLTPPHAPPAGQPDAFEGVV